MNLYKLLGIALILLFSVSSCEIDEIPNPNGPSLESFENGATAADLKLLATGLASVMRTDLGFYYNTVSIVGREYYDLNGVDPRYTGELLGAGAGAGVLDNNGFLTTRSFAARYRAVKNANVLITAVENSAAGLSDEEKNGYYGYAKTLKAYALLLVANRQYNNGIRVEVSDPDNLGPFTANHDNSLSEIQALLGEAATDLANGGDNFVFSAPGFDSSVGGFWEFNKALSARVAIYQGNKSNALSYLNDSYFDLNGGLDNSTDHLFGGLGGNDLNPIFFAPNADLYLAQSSFLTDAEAGDSRTGKVTMLDTAVIGVPVTLDGLSGTHQVSLYGSNTSPIPIIRNEELILIYAEANIGSDNNEAVAALNVVRNAAGVGDYTGDTDDAALVDELLHQRRYSLFGEGHRWIDMRRYGRLDELPNDRDGDEVFEQFPRPVLEQ